MNLREKALGAVEGLVQNFTPVKQIHQHVCGFHGYAHDMSRQACSRQAVCSWNADDCDLQAGSSRARKNIQPRGGKYMCSDREG